MQLYIFDFSLRLSIERGGSPFRPLKSGGDYMRKVKTPQIQNPHASCALPVGVNHLQYELFTAQLSPKENLP
jgi:hypothetical protein